MPQDEQMTAPAAVAEKVVEGKFRMVQTKEGVHYEPIAQPEPTGTAVVESARSKTKRELEMEAGRQRVAANAREVAARPPRVISERERMAEGHNVAVFRPNQVQADRVTGWNGQQISQHLGTLMRRMKAAPEAPPAPEAPASSVAEETSAAPVT